ncbi:hypothetical protein AVEN_110888-1 [Araneus ventricosus]|uniref:Uncharacterized protein n=1 Tax=Araneus ventricosus TaxID=182803 RepID=A0A4Y2PPE2_ARAVE|nr:hypothetical protein AVEN_110888-1 [Araneus ventricosus]
MKYDMAITSYTEGTAIPTAETRIERSFISEAILKTTKCHGKTEQYIKGNEKRFSETIEVSIKFWTKSAHGKSVCLYARVHVNAITHKLK